MVSRVPSSPGASQRHVERLSDFDLLQRLRKRDVASLRELHRRHAGFVGAVATRVLGRTEDAERIVQDVFIHLWSHGFHLEEQRARFLSWLFVAARNRAIERRRTARPNQEEREDPRRLTPILSAVPEGGDDSEETLLRREERRLVRASLERLTESERMIVEMAFFSGYTHTEIAGELAAPLEDVKKRLRKAMKNLRAGVTGDAPGTREAEVEAAAEKDEVSGETASRSAATIDPDALGGMAAAYALGALDGEELNAFEARLSEGDADLWGRVREYESTTDGLVQLIDSVTLEQGAYERLEMRMTEEGFLRAKAEDDFEAGRFGWRRLAKFGAFLFLVLLVGTMYTLDVERRAGLSDLAVSEQGRAELGRELAALKKQISAVELEKRQVEVDLMERNEAFQSVTRPSGRDLPLKAISKELDAEGRALIDAETGRIWLSIDSLPLLPSDQTYQFWVIVDSEPIDAGVFDAREGEIRIEASAMPKEAAAAGNLSVGVTVEPEGGSPLPTGRMILSGR